MIATRLAGPVAVLSIEREERRNALDVEHCTALAAAVRSAADTGSRVLVVTGAGSSFCAGADFSEVGRPDFRDHLRDLLAAVEEAPVPVLAAVNGPAVGAGTQLAMACDLRVAAPGAVFGLPTARLGLAVDGWTVRRLAALVGAGRAAGVLIGCESVDAEAAVGGGLANRLGSLDDAVAWAAEIAGWAPLTMAWYKRALAATAAEPPVELLEAVWASEDAAEGQMARAEGRAPRFRGR